MKIRKKNILIKNKAVIIILLIICGILPSLLIKFDSFMHQSDCLIISNLEDAIYNDCKMTSKGVEIYGPDPYLILGGFDIGLKSVQLICNKQNNLKSVQVFYDDGTGFCENNSVRAPGQSSGAFVRFDDRYHVKTIRVDFETASDFDAIDLQEIRLNARWTMQFDNKVLIGGALLIVLSLLVSWTTMKCSSVSKKELISFVAGEVGALISCHGFMYLHESKDIFLFGCMVMCLTIFLSQLVYYENEKIIFTAFILFVFFTLLFWICTIPYNDAPDEAMRYDIINYIVQYRRIPLGEEAEIRHASYGFSYGFTPINIYILDALFVKIALFFTKNFNTLIIIARIPNVLLAIGTIFFSYGIACEKLLGRAKWIFLSGVMLLPEMLFIFSYVNCDGIAVFSFAWIVFYMIKAEKKRWAPKECLMLGLGIGICLLSYYNAYSVILTTIIYCVVSVLTDTTINNKFRFLLQRTIWVFIPAFLYAGWWFIRGAFYHNGDFLGLATSRKYGELYGMEGFKPSQRSTPYNMGFSLHYMLYDMNWLKISSMSFVAAFGLMSIFMSDAYYQVYYGSIVAAFVIAIVYLGKRHISRGINGVVSNRLGFSRFSIYMFANMLISFAIALYYSYFNDFQPQGRYFILVIFSVMFFVAKCLEFNAEEKSFNLTEMNIKKGIQVLYPIFFVAIFEYAFISGVIQHYF